MTLTTLFLLIVVSYHVGLLVDRTPSCRLCRLTLIAPLFAVVALICVIFSMAVCSGCFWLQSVQRFHSRKFRTSICKCGALVNTVQGRVSGSDGSGSDGDGIGDSSGHVAADIFHMASLAAIWRKIFFSYFSFASIRHQRANWGQSIFTLLMLIFVVVILVVVVANACWRWWFTLCSTTITLPASLTLCHYSNTSSFPLKTLHPTCAPLRAALLPQPLTLCEYTCVDMHIRVAVGKRCKHKTLSPAFLSMLPDVTAVAAAVFVNIFCFVFCYVDVRFHCSVSNAVSDILSHTIYIHALLVVVDFKAADVFAAAALVCILLLIHSFCYFPYAVHNMYVYTYIC